jgi:hypothetical protein
MAARHHRPVRTRAHCPVIRRQVGYALLGLLCLAGVALRFIRLPPFAGAIVALIVVLVVVGGLSYLVWRGNPWDQPDDRDDSEKWWLDE